MTKNNLDYLVDICNYINGINFHFLCRPLSMYTSSSETEIKINNETYFSIKNYALKAKQSMELLGKNGYAIVDMFFPNCMYSYHLKDTRLEVSGLCDKIEIIDGKYYPISVRHSTPPIKGVWDQDAIDLAATAILIEEEFETEEFEDEGGDEI